MTEGIDDGPDDRDREVDADGIGSLTVVSNRQPYGHVYAADGIEVVRSDGGLITALDDALEAVDGEWIAWGSESADFDPAVVTDEGLVRESERRGEYALRRVDVPDSLVDDYYYGYSNQVLWPLFHLDTSYVNVAPGYWDAYRRVNESFARAVLERSSDAIWFHDYHFAIAPRVVRESTDGTPTTAHFLHIPWPPTEVFRICPHARAILDGFLANDHVGLQAEGHRANFLDCAATLLPGATVDRETGVVRYQGRRIETHVRPVGVDPEAIAATVADDADADGGYWGTLARRFGIDPATTVCVGVDRLDYAKGLVERLDALEHLWADRPELRGELVYVQKATPSRERIDRYREYGNRVRERVREINDRFGGDDWQPIVYLEEDLAAGDLYDLYRQADVCLVTSKKDGMNLVAQEFVAASRETGGVLVLSEFAGAADLLGDGARLVNPVHVEAVADAVAGAVSEAIDPDAAQRRDHMERMLAAVEAHSIDDWLEAHLRLFE